MKWKKLTSLMLVTSLGFAMLTGCGGEGDTNQKADNQEADHQEADNQEEVKSEAGKDTGGETVQLQVAVFEGGYGKEYWEAVAGAFEAEHEGVEVVIQSSPELGDVIRPQILAGNPPDFVYLPSTTSVTKAMIKDKALADITDVMEELEDQFYPGFLDSSFCRPYEDGNIYLAPIYYSAVGLWYNKDYFEKNNLEIPVTWDEFFALGDQVEDRALFTYQGLYPSYLECLIVPAIASAAGRDVMDRCFQYDASAWQGPTVKEVLDNIAKIGTEGYLMEGTVALNHTQAQSQWLMGDAIFCPNGSWVEGEMADAPREDGFEYGFTACPVLSADNEKMVFTNIEEMWIPAAAKNVELAKEFLKFQYSDEAIQMNAELAKGVPPIIGANEYLKDSMSEAVYESRIIFEKGYTAYIGGFANVEDTEIMPFNEFYDPMGEIMTGQMSVDDWIAKMVEISEELQDKIVK